MADVRNGGDDVLLALHGYDIDVCAQEKLAGKGTTLLEKGAGETCRCDWDEAAGRCSGTNIVRVGVETGSKLGMTSSRLLLSQRGSRGSILGW